VGELFLKQYKKSLIGVLTKASALISIHHLLSLSYYDHISLKPIVSCKLFLCIVLMI